MSVRAHAGFCTCEVFHIFVPGHPGTPPIMARVAFDGKVREFAAGLGQASLHVQKCLSVLFSCYFL